jgi:uncharacterized linocin/CFP29 family protein
MADEKSPDQIDLDNLRAAYSRLAGREFTEVQLPGGRIFKYRDLAAVRKEITRLEIKLGLRKRVPRILESYI